jgi:hypothetical protein
MSEVASRGKPELRGVSISTSRAEVSKAVSSVWLVAHKGTEGNGFGGNMREDIKRVSGDDVGKVRDHSDAVPGIRGLVGRGVNGWGRMRKSRGRVRT